MNGTHQSLSRREFLGGLTMATAVGLTVNPGPGAAEPPPETRRIRIAKVPAIHHVNVPISNRARTRESYEKVPER